MARLNASKSWLASCWTAVLNSWAGAGVLANEHTRSAAQAIHQFKAKHEGSPRAARFGLGGLDGHALELRLLAVAADVGVGPVSHLLGAVGDEGAPSIRANRAFGLPHHLELTVRLDFGDQ